jgi:UDPglucose 6-dehydrogenase
MEALWKAGACIRAFDPVAMTEAARIYGERDDLALCESPEETLEGANAVIIVTEWNMFRSPDFDRVKRSLAEPIIFDGRNLYDPARMKSMGFEYFAIGRGERLD